MEKISVSDLSVGDWVNIYHRGVKTSYRIKRIFPSEYDGVYMIRTHTNWDVNINGLMPIPITAEVLEKNGFKIKHKGIEFDHYDTNLEDGKTLLLSFDRGENYYLMYEEKGKRGMHQIDCPLRSVHQLQHALRLARVEKEITL